MDSDILCDPAAVVRIAREPESALALNRHECGEEEIKDRLMEALKIQDYKIKFMGDKGLESCLRITLGRKEQTQTVVDTILRVYNGK